MPSSIISCSNLSIAHQQNLILKEINLEFYEGSWIEIIGANSTGKTSFLNAIYGLNHDLTGSLKVLDHEVNPLSANFQEIRRKIGFYSDEIPLITAKTLRANLSLAMTAANRIPELNIEQIQKNVLQSLSLSNKLLQVVDQLSSAEKTLAKMARLFIIKPKLILLDCPFRNLDTENSEILIKSLKEYQTIEKACILICTDTLTRNNSSNRVVYLMENLGIKLMN